MKKMEKGPNSGAFLAGNISHNNSHNRLNHEHPFQNSAILDEIFKFFRSSSSVRDAKKIRATCKMWNECTLNAWHKTAVLKLGPPSTSMQTQDQGGHRTTSPDPFLPVDQFICLVLAPSDPLSMRRNPFRNYALHNVDFSKLPDALKVSTSPSTRYNIRTDNLWSTMGAFEMDVDSFKFENCTFPTNKLEQFNCTLTTQLKDVKRLTFKNNILEPAMISSVVDAVEQKQLRTLLQSGKFEPKYTNLETLEICGVIPLDLHVFLVNCPVLKKLNVKKQTVSFTFSQLQRTLLTARRDSRGKVDVLRKLESLDVMDSAFFRHTTQLIEDALVDMDLPLTSISLNLEPHQAYSRVDFYAKDVHDILTIYMPIVTHYRNSLKILKLFRPPVFQATCISYPDHEMSCLEELHIWGNVVYSFVFLFATPRLRVLYINTPCEDKADELKQLYIANGEKPFVRLFWERYIPVSLDMMMTMRPGGRSPGVIHLEHMKTLHLECTMSSQMIRILARWMPNLKSFKGIFKNYEFAAVCEWFPNLSELGCLFNSSVDDATFIGQKRNRESPNNIRVLHCLKRFEYQAYCTASRIGNELVYNGLLKMPYLEAVEIYVSESLSKQAEALLKKRVPQVKVIRNYGNNSHGDGECCRRWAFHTKTFY